MGSDFEEATQAGLDEPERSGETPSAPLWITVASRAGVLTLPLPSRGTVTVGRAAECEIHIDDPTMSRRHACLHIGAAIEIEDLGSRNGTSVRGQAQPSGARTVLEVGDVVSFGATVLVLQAAPTDRPRRILQHGYFEMYLEGECARAAAGGLPFAVARLRVGSSNVEAVEHLLAVALAPIDQFAAYAPGEYEVLMLGVGETVARERLDDLSAQLAPIASELRAGLACYPHDGRTPEEIIAAAAPESVKQEGADSGPIDTTSLERLQPLIRRVAAGNINVLILGETGAGKEVMADRLHKLSPRAEGPLLSLNCAALSETLLESELFGYERGAFTGAVAAKPGLLETAAGGTVFLDEIGEMPLPIQAKLLRVIEQKQVLRLGALRPKPIDVRFVAATHRDLEDEVARGRFRQDLYFRLNGISLVVPPLRDRQDEIGPLAAGFVKHAAKQLGLKVAPRITAETLERLRAYSWPGNIRELRNVMERAVLLSSNGVITPNEIPSEKMGRTLRTRLGSMSGLPRLVEGAVPQPAPPAANPPSPSPRATLPPGAFPAVPVRAANPTGSMPTIEGSRPIRDEPTSALPLLSPDDPDDERQRIIAALEACAGNQSAAAKMLGISRRTLVYRITEYNLPRPRGKRGP